MEPSQRLPRVPVRDGYDRWAPHYDDYDNAVIALEQPVVTRLIGDAPGRVADIGCGTGRHALPLAARGARVTGVDFSTGMLAALRRKRPPATLTLIEHDLRTGLPLATGAFDTVLCSLVLEHITALGDVLGEFVRVLRPGGRVVLADLHPEMFRRGLHARFRVEGDEEKIQIEGVDHTISDYVMAIVGAGLVIEAMEEHRMDEVTAARSPSARKYIGEPMLLCFALRAPA
ncbi:MAG: class I SAM-dependent methyltransferase [Myxococcales bacterium]|nr:class I SAM-dependent methyltransferase [Myxococcales bacterium]MCB9751519.1 class I SAM-dependent methyltransferase [Myxococcales bacterium]